MFKTLLPVVIRIIHGKVSISFEMDQKSVKICIFAYLGLRIMPAGHHPKYFPNPGGQI